ncbi:MAG: hypothetical protein JNM02_02545 [Anaerolineales bacterium]|nr:hypothetical protein [Anaerolineales bacterium]
MALAGRGSRLTTNEVEDIEDQSELKQVRLQALKVLGKSTLVAIALTFLVMLLP